MKMFISKKGDKKSMVAMEISLLLGLYFQSNFNIKVSFGDFVKKKDFFAF